MNVRCVLQNRLACWLCALLAMCTWDVFLIFLSPSCFWSSKCNKHFENHFVKQFLHPFSKFYFFSSLLKYKWQIKYIFLRCTMWYFDITLLSDYRNQANYNIHHLTLTFVIVVLVVTTFKINSISRFQVHYTGLLTVVTPLYVRYENLFILHNWNFVHFDQLLPISHTP